jgi:ParB-like chromosome segregation protein Spo0J
MSSLPFILLGHAHHPGRLIDCRIDELRLHPGYARHHLSVPAARLSRLAEHGDLAFRDPLWITQSRIILDGHARYQLASSRGRETLPCIEHNLAEEDALLWIIQKHQRHNGFNDFSRICLALELEPWLKERARYNQQLGGQHKGSSNLTEADHRDVRSQIADIAKVSTGNISKVRQLLSSAHPDVLAALRIGEVSIHRASLWLRPPERQIDYLRQHRNLRGITRTVNSLIQAHHRPVRDNKPFDLQRIATALAALDSAQRDSVLVAEVKVEGEVLLLSPGLRQSLEKQGELEL